MCWAQESRGILGAPLCLWAPFLLGCAAFTPPGMWVPGTAKPLFYLRKEAVSPGGPKSLAAVSEGPELKEGVCAHVGSER